jgi:hypothetical protein
MMLRNMHGSQTPQLSISKEQNLYLSLLPSSTKSPRRFLLASSLHPCKAIPQQYDSYTCGRASIVHHTTLEEKYIMGVDADEGSLCMQVLVTLERT